MAGGVAVYVMLRSYLLTARGAAPAAAYQRRSGSSTGCSSRCPGGWPRWLEGLLGTRRLQPQLQLLAGAAFVAALTPLYARGLVVDGPPHGRSRPRFRAALGSRDRLRPRRRLSGQVSPPRGADPARRRRPRHLRQLRLAVGARSRADAARRRDRDHGAPPARPALAAQTHSRRSTPRRARHDPMASRPRLRDRARRRSAGWRRSPIAAMTRPAPDSISRYLRGERLHEGRRHQRRQRHPGRLPRLRHPRRDHRARRRRADRLRAAAAVPPGAREHPGSRAAARPERLRRRAIRIARRATPSRTPWPSRR